MSISLATAQIEFGLEVPRLCTDAGYESVRATLHTRRLENIMMT